MSKESDFVDLLNKEMYELKIAYLEAKLAECEEKKESYRLQNEQHHLQLLQFYSRLGVEAFGADIHEKALETLMIMKEELVEKKGLERALSACNRQNDEFAEMIKKLVREKQELKEQLANQNQDQQITELRELHAIKDDASDCITINGVKFSYEQMLIIDEINNNYRMNIKKLNQQLKSQKQLAIEELKKVKEYNHTLSLGGSPYVDVFIDNQIKELKGVKNE